MTDRIERGSAPVDPRFQKFRSAVSRVDQASRGMVIGAMAVMAILVVVQVVFRYALSSAIDWSEEIARLAFVWAMFLAIPHGIRHGAHVGIDVLVSQFSPAIQSRMFRISSVLGLILMAFVFYYGGQVTIYTWPERLPTVNLTAAVYYVAVLLAAAHSMLHLALLAWGGPQTWDEEYVL